MTVSLLDLRGRIALVTGAGQGVGRQIALHFARYGAGGVVVNDFVRERAEQVAAEVQRAGAKALPCAGDVSQIAAVRGMVAAAEAAFGQIDILVNNAGNAGPGHYAPDTKTFWETPESDWDRWLGTNLYGVLNCTHATIGQMVRRGYGRVITIVSDAGRVGEPGLVVYSAAKAGAAGFMRAIARAVASANVTANCVALGGTETPTTAAMMANPDLRKRILAHYPVKRLGQPEDAANMALFLASDAASWVTGQTYPVNGGYSFAV